jgi:hypothetical protein
LITAAGAPTANHTLFVPSSNNKLSSTVAELDTYRWDGVGDGMTNSAGGAGGDFFFAPGFTQRSFGGSVITGLGAAVGFQVQASEIGIFNVTVNGFFVSKGEEL